MTMPGVGDATIGEVARTLDRFERSTNSRLSDLAASITLMVTRDLYDAHRDEMRADIADLRAEDKALREELKAERDRKTADRRMVVGAFLTASLAIVVTLVTALLKIT